MTFIVDKCVCNDEVLWLDASVEYTVFATGCDGIAPLSEHECDEIETSGFVMIASLFEE